MEKVRTVEPYLVGRSMQEEVKHDYHDVPLLHGTIHTGFS
jgi:hypothetical protein